MLIQLTVLTFLLRYRLILLVFHIPDISQETSMDILERPKPIVITIIP